MLLSIANSSFINLFIILGLTSPEKLFLPSAYLYIGGGVSAIRKWEVSPFTHIFIIFLFFYLLKFCIFFDKFNYFYNSFYI